MSNNPPIEVPQGAIRLNTDSQKLEFFAQDRWYEMATHSNILNGSAGRALIFEGDASSNKIDVIHIDTQGNATDFGVSHYNNDSVGASGDRTRALVYGGGSPSTTNKIEFHTIASTGISGIDFGDLTFTGRQPGNANNSTRSLMCGGYPSPYSTGNAVNTICYVTTQSLGNALDFGDLITTGEQIMSSSPTRGVGIGGYGVGASSPSGSPGRLTECQFITTHTLGNSQKFSDLTVARNDANGAGSNIRGVFLGGAHDSGQTDAITFVEFASLGNTVDFGNLINAGQSHCCTSNQIRAVKTNGSISPTSTNRIEFVNIATGGDAVEFGDATYTGASSAAHCSAQGGL
jgi:hypothetical protein